MNWTALAVFGVVLAGTLAITWWAARRTRTASDFWAAGGGISGTQNGFAIAGDYMSAATFLGFTGLVFLAGFDGWVPALCTAVAFIPVMLLIAERMRNAGKYTIADVLAFRLNARPVRAAVAVTTLFIVGIYLTAQLVGAGVLIRALTGVEFAPAVIATAAFMLIYVVFGGMLATTYVQIVKAVLLLGAGVVLTILVLARFGFNPVALFDSAARHHPKSEAMLAPGLTKEALGGTLGILSLGAAFVFGTAGLPHILMRFFTVPDARAARRSVLVAVAVIGFFFVLVSFIGFGARAILGSELGVAAAGDAVGKGGNLAVPLLAEELGGELFLALIVAVAIATILAVVAGLTLAASAAVTHDLWSQVIRRGAGSEREEPRVARISTVVIGIVAVTLTLLAGPSFNVAFVAGLAFSVAASTNFPCLVYAFFWRPFNTAGALTAIAFGLVSATILIVLSPTVWPGPDSQGSPFALTYPALVSIPLGFLGGWLGTVLSRPQTEDERYYEMLVRAETGIGAEGAVA
jgi:cation/acetate symporter